MIKSYFRCHSILCFTMCFLMAAAGGLGAGDSANDWTGLFNGRSLEGWKSSGSSATWKVKDGLLAGYGPRSYLFYTGPVGGHDFQNFELEAVVKTGKGADSGIFFHTQYQKEGRPEKGYEVQINNACSGKRRQLARTGSLYGVRNIYKPFVPENQWFCMRLRVVGNRIRIWVDGQPAVDYLQPESADSENKGKRRFASSKTVALQAHDPESRVWFRSVKVRLLRDDADPMREERAPDKGYGITRSLMDRLGSAHFPVIDYHVHLRGGMTVQKAMDRQAVTGINCGVLRNIGKGWPVENDRQLRAFIKSVKDKPLFIGVQVNDRNWMDFHDPELLKQLDYALGDTMIMAMPDDESPPVKLWQTGRYTIDDPESWMKRYMKHNLTVVNEPITILANPTYLPAPVKDKYDELWTDARMRTLIQAAIDNGVALEINARSGLPHPRFIRMAKKMGAKFTFGTNNFRGNPISMRRCFRAIERYGLTKDDIYVAKRKQLSARLGLRWRRTDTSLALLKGGKVIWKHVHDERLGKPYMRIGLVDGTGLTRPWPFPKDYPKADHTWHRALWWSWKKINGVNYWEKNQKGTEPVSVDITHKEDGRAEIRLKISYHEKNKGPVVYEKRVIKVSAPDVHGSYLITWRAAFTPAGKENVVFNKNSYGGLALRMAAECCGPSRGGKTPWTFFDSEGHKNANNRRARWVGYRGTTPNGRPAGVVVLDHPDNPRHPSWWQTRPHYPYLNPSFTCKRDFTLASGESLTLTYGILVHDGPLDREAAEAAWKGFSK